MKSTNSKQPGGSLKVNLGLVSLLKEWNEAEKERMLP